MTRLHVLPIAAAMLFGFVGIAEACDAGLAAELGMTCQSLTDQWAEEVDRLNMEQQLQDLRREMRERTDCDIIHCPDY